MRYMIWALRFVLLVLLVLFALKNTSGVDIHFLGSAMLTGIPLFMIIFASFILGALYMYLLNLPARFCRRQEMNRLRSEVQHLQADLNNRQAADSGMSVSTVSPPEGFVATKS